VGVLGVICRRYAPAWLVAELPPTKLVAYPLESGIQPGSGPIQLTEEFPPGASHLLETL